MKIGFIGCGNMGSALAAAISQNMQNKLYIFDTNTEKMNSIAKALGAETMDAKKIAECVDILFLAVKPNIISAALLPLGEAIAKNPSVTVVSMAAGVRIDRLSAILPVGTPIIRIMPNTPVSVGCGMTAYATNEYVSAEREAAFLSVMKSTGELDRLSEQLIDAESAIAGSGPAFAYMFVDALADGGVLSGLPRDKAILYAAKMLEGAAKLLLTSGEHPGALKDKVCSPGGSTIEGVMALEQGAFRAAVSEAVVATCEKAKKLGG